MINGTDTAAAKVETVSPMTIMQMIQEVSVRLSQQGLEEKECSPEEWKIDFFFPPGEGVSRQTASVSPLELGTGTWAKFRLGTGSTPLHSLHDPRLTIGGKQLITGSYNTHVAAAHR